MTPYDARAAIRALRVGAAPVNQASLLAVGQRAVCGVLNRALARLGPTASAIGPILVEGHWGSGKSQTLALAKALARDRGIATAAVTFNARGAPLSHPNRVYPVLAQTIEAGGATGLRSLIRCLLQDARLNELLARFAGEQADPFGVALRDLHRAHAQGDALLLGRSWAWSILLGTDLTVRDDAGRKAAAVRRLAALAGLMRACGYGGLVILGDEMESLAQLWSSASRASAYNAMGFLFGLPSVLWVLGAAGNFERMVAYDLDQSMPASWRMKDTGRAFFEQWCAGEFRRVTPPTLGPEDAEQLARVVAEVYAAGYGLAGPDIDASLSTVVRDWSVDPSRNPRRLARGLVEKLDCLRELPISRRIAS